MATSENNGHAETPPEPMEETVVETGTGNGRRVVIVSVPFTPILGVQEGSAIIQKFPMSQLDPSLPQEISPTEEGFLRAWDILSSVVSQAQENLDRQEQLSTLAPPEPLTRAEQIRERARVRK